jgi:putative addiction module component (TIGR02574 family)
VTQLASKVFAEAVQLSDGERADLAAKLIARLAPGTEEDVESAWGEELRRRLDEVQSAKVRPVPWPEARRMILEDADGADTP